MSYLIAVLSVLAVAAVIFVAVRYPWMLGRKYRSGLYPLSADPPTYGHRDIIMRAARRCVHLYVIIGNNPAKKYLFTVEERVGFMQEMLAEAGITNVTVVSEGGLQSDLTMKYCAQVIWRGIRNKTDLEFEESQGLASALFRPGYERKIRYIRAEAQWRQVSSSLVKGFSQMGVAVSLWTLAKIEKALVAKLGRWHVRIAAHAHLLPQTMALADAVVSAFEKQGIKAQHIGLKRLREEFYNERSPQGIEFRIWLTQIFGSDVLSADCAQVDIDVLEAKLQTPCWKCHREEFDRRAREGMMRLYRDRMNAAKGVIILTWNPDVYREGGELSDLLMFHEEHLDEQDAHDPAAVAALVAKLLFGIPPFFLEGARLPSKPASKAASAVATA